jgi:hypothetical protein
MSVVSFNHVYGDDEKEKHEEIGVRKKIGVRVAFFWEASERSLPAAPRSLPSRQMKLVQAWIELHRDELMADWTLAASGQAPYKIDPLR